MADYKGLTIKFGADDSGLSEALKRIDSSVKYTEQNLKTLQDALKINPKSTTLISDAFKIAKNNAKAWGDEVKVLQDKSDKYTATAGKMRAELQNLEKYGNDAGLAHQFLSGEVEKLESRLETTNIALDIAKERFKEAQTIQETWTTQVEVSKDKVYNLATNVSDTGRVLHDFGDKLTNVGTKLTIFSGIVASTIGRQAIQNAEEYGNQISLLGGYLDIDGARLDEMSDAALYWGKETIFSAVEAAEAMNELAKGGLTEAEIKGGALEATLSAAAAGNIDLASAADIVVQSMRTFNMDAEDATSIADALAGAANASTAEIGDLSAGFVNVGGMARLAGWDINDVSGALALMADNGFSGALAGTALKVMLQRLAAPTNKAAGVMEDLGIEVRDAEGHMKPATEIVDIFSKATADLADDERDAALQTIFGTRAINAILALMNSGSDTLGRYIEATEQQGYATEVAQKRLGDLGWALELLRGEAETASVNLGRSLTPILVDLAGKAEDLLGWFNSLTDAERDQVTQLGLMAVAAGPAAVVLGTFLKGFGGAATAIGDTVRFIKLFNAAGGNGAGVAERLGKAMAVLKGDTENATKYIAGAESALGGLKVAAILAGAALAAFIAWEFVQYLQDVAKDAENADKATHAFSDTVGLLDSSGAQGELDSLSGKLEDLTLDYGDTLEAHNKLADKIAERNSNAASEIATWEQVSQILRDYGGAARELSDEELGKLQWALSQVNDEMGTNYKWNEDLKQITDENGEAVEGLTDKIEANIEMRKQQIKLNAINETLTDLYKQQFDEQELVRQKTEELASANEALAKAQEGVTGANGQIKLTAEEAAAAQAFHKEEVARLEGELAGAQGALNDTNGAIETYSGMLTDTTKKVDETAKAIEGFAGTLEEAIRSTDLGELFEDDGAFQAFIDHLTNAGFSVEDFVSLTDEQQQQLVAAWQDTNRLSAVEFAIMLSGIQGLSSGVGAELQKMAEDTGYSSEEIAAALKNGIETGELSYNDSMPVIMQWLYDYAANNPPNKYLYAEFSESGYDDVIWKLDNFNKYNSRTIFLNAIATYSENAAGGIRQHAMGGIRYHAEGGAIVNVPKYGYPLDLVGEAGAEAIVPLTNRRYSKPFVDLIANGIASKFPANSGVTINVGSLVVREQADIDRIGNNLNAKIMRAQRGAL